MKYKYIVVLLVALGFGGGFAAEIALNDYDAIHASFTRGGTADLNAALQNNQGFDHNADGDKIRSSSAGFALRTAVIRLSFDELKDVVENNHDFFKTSLGLSLIYGWALNQFKDANTPYYLGRYFSFDKMFQGMANNIGDINVKTFLKSRFTLGLKAVEDDRWVFYDHMLYLPYAIEQVRAAVVPVDGAVAAPLPSVDMIIADARRSSDEARTETANLVPLKAGRAAHLMGVAAGPISDCNDLEGLQKCIIQLPGLNLFGNKDVKMKSQLLSLSNPVTIPNDYLVFGAKIGVIIVATQPLIAEAKNMAARQVARSLPAFFANRSAAIVGILRAFRAGNAFLKTEALKDALALVNTPVFLMRDQDSNPASFPGSMVEEGVYNGRDPYLVRELARRIREILPAFMVGIPAYDTVIGYEDGKGLKGILGYKPERAAICAVRDALRRVKIEVDGSLSLS